MTRNGLFISYSHADKRWLKEFHTQLDPLVRRGLVLWDDTHLAPGATWHAEIQQAIARCRVALLLVSPSFLASDFINQWELPPLLQARAAGQVNLLWVHLRACLYDESPVGALQAAHDVSRPLDSLPVAQRSAVVVEVCRRVKEAMAITSAGAPDTPPPGARELEYALVLSGKVSADDRPVVDALLAQLRGISRDARLSLVQIQPGSIHLTLRGTEEGFLELQTAFLSGDLAAALGRDAHALFPVQTVQPPAQQATEAPPSSNRLGAILSRGCVLAGVSATSKAHAFAQAGLLFEREHGVAHALVTDNLFARERLGSTGLGLGVAVPHGRIKGLLQPLAAVMRLNEPIPFDAPDDAPVTLMVFLLVPEAATSRHLQILSEIAEMLQDQPLRDALKGPLEAQHMYELIRGWSSLRSAA
jgi:PTS system nitrogen regulatory IIA component